MYLGKGRVAKSLTLGAILLACLNAQSSAIKFEPSNSRALFRLVKRSLNSKIDELQAQIQANPKLSQTTISDMDANVKAAIATVKSNSNSLESVPSTSWATIIKAANNGKLAIGDILQTGISLDSLESASTKLPQVLQDQVEVAVGNMYQTALKILATGSTSATSSEISSSGGSASSENAGSSSNSNTNSGTSSSDGTVAPNSGASSTTSRPSQTSSTGPTVTTEVKTQGNSSESDSGNGLSDGQILGIVLGSIGGCILVALLLVFGYRKHKREEQLEKAASAVGDGGHLVGAAKENPLYRDPTLRAVSALSSTAPMGINSDDRSFTARSGYTASSVSSMSSVRTLGSPLDLSRTQNSRLYSEFRSTSSRVPSSVLPAMVPLYSVSSQNADESRGRDASRMPTSSVVSDASMTSSLYPQSVLSEVPVLAETGNNSRPFVSQLDPLPNSLLWESAPPSYAPPKVRESQTSSAFEEQSQHNSIKPLMANSEFVENKVRDSFMTGNSVDGSRWSQLIASNQRGSLQKQGSRNLSLVEQTAGAGNHRTTIVRFVNS